MAADLIVSILKSKTHQQTLSLEFGRQYNLTELKQVFRGIARQVHPDKSSCPGAKEAFIKLHSAFEIVCESAVQMSHPDVVVNEMKSSHFDKSETNPPSTKVPNESHSKRKHYSEDFDFSFCELNKEETEQKDSDMKCKWFQYRAKQMRHKWYDNVSEIPRFEDMFGSDEESAIQMDVSASTWRAFTTERLGKKQRKTEEVNNIKDRTNTFVPSVVSPVATSSESSSKIFHNTSSLPAELSVYRCVLCRRQFASENHLFIHQKHSAMHQENLKKQLEKCS